LRERWRDGDAVALAMLASAFALKLAYSRAGADDLAWVLVPSGWLATHVGGLDLTWEPLAGFISHQPRLVVGPPCAGVNFLVVAWLATFFASQGALTGARKKLAWWGATLAMAYVATVVTNGARIVLAAHLQDASIYTALITKARVHRLLGVVLYCGVLVALCRATSACVRGALAAPTFVTHLSWFGWYVGVAVLLPIANRAFMHNSGRFAEHAAFTLAAGFAVLSAFWLGGRMVDRVCSRRAVS
jgi:exosortase K